MCGIFAIFQPASRVDGDAVERALDSLRHRGPDDRGTWSDLDAGVVLGHTRLSILDVSEAGRQPMVSASGRFVVAFNGEIYNHRELRARLEASLPDGAAGMAWRGHSDTETLLACIEAWGLEEAIAQASGMFAIVLWDRQSRRLSLVRDRVGEKPLYYAQAGGLFAVASEVRAFEAMGSLPLEIDRRSLGMMMRFCAIPAPYSIFRGVSKLPPGHCLALDLDQVHRGEAVSSRPYWRADEIARDLSTKRRQYASDGEAIDALHACLGEAVRRQLISDVPLGAFLSGGIDSSVVVALMQEEAGRRGADAVRTFSIGFDEAGFDEARYARRVAAHLGTRHTELYVSERDCFALVPELATIYDEPFADSSQIGVCLVSRLAVGQVKAALTGDGGDEVFGGYNRYTRAASLWRRIEGLPYPLRRIAAGGATSSPGRVLARMLDRLGETLPGTMRPPRLSDRVEKLSQLLLSHDPCEVYRSLVEFWAPEEVLLDHGAERSPLLDQWPQLPDLEEQMMLLDLSFVLPTDMLAKVDRAAMSVGLETRLPFLDPQVLEFAWRLPLHYKVRDGQGKWLVKQLLHRFVPKELVERPKMGFESPVARWLRGPLREWAESLLDERLLREQGYFRAPVVRKAWEDHLAGRNEHPGNLWTILSFQAWLREQSRQRTAPAS